MEKKILTNLNKICLKLIEESTINAQLIKKLVETVLSQEENK